MDRPILFSAPMIKALLAGQKQQTRRILKPQPDRLNGGKPLNNGRGAYSTEGGWKKLRFASGDRLWIREAWRADDYMSGETIYRADAPADALSDTKGIIKWKPGIHLHCARSRLTLVVTGVKVERLQDISEEDAVAEGAYQCENGWSYGGSPLAGSTARGAYYCLWQHINGPGSWESNPWVAAISFTVHKTNIGAMKEAA